MEFATTEAAWASASGSRPSASIRSMAPWRWTGFTLEPLGQAVEGLADAEEPDRDDLRPAPPRGDRGLRASDQHPASRPLRPEPVQIRRVLQVVEHDQPGLVGRAQPATEARRDRFGRAGGLDAERPPPRPARTRTARMPGRWRRSRSARRWPPDRHSDSAMITAIWVLPQAPSQFDGPSAKAEPGTSARVAPGTSASTMPRAVSGRSVYPSASGGTSPTRNR